MKKILKLPNLFKFILIAVVAILFQNCTQEKILETTDTTPNITNYLKAKPEYSLFLEILNITKYASFMNTYGTYTLFLPTNDAVKEYLKDVGATSLSQVPLADLQNLAKLHILEQKVSTSFFTDGKISTPSMHGQYLITGAINVDGVTSTTVNKTSKIIASNVAVGNGVIHVIDKMLRTADKTLAETIEANSELSLFTELLKATGWYEKLNQPLTYDANKVGSHLTVLLQTNEVFSKAGFHTLDDLKAKYSNTSDPTSPDNGLNKLVQYHIILKLNYLADLATTSVFETKAPLEVISSTLIKDAIYLNRDVFNGVLEEGFPVTRESSDLTCSNGVLHYVSAHFDIKKRVPLPVYFDLCNQSEFAANVINYRKPAGLTFGYGAAKFSEITWTGNQAYELKWVPNSLAWNGDQLEVFRLRPGSGGQQNVTFTTPVIIKGRYKIWVSYRTNGSGSTQVKSFFDGVQLPRLINLRESANPISGTSYMTDRVLESQGYKRPMYPFVNTSIYSRFVGIVEVTTTGKHKFTLHSDVDGGQAWFDIVEFRPVDMDQIWPKFKAGLAGEGGLVQREDAPKDN